MNALQKRKTPCGHPSSYGYELLGYVTVSLFLHLEMPTDDVNLPKFQIVSAIRSSPLTLDLALYLGEHIDDEYARYQQYTNGDKILFLICKIQC